MSLLNLKQQEKNNLLLQLSQCKKYIEHSQSTLERFKNTTNLDKTFLAHQTLKLQENISQKEDRINELEYRLLQLEKGELDEELRKRTHHHTQEIRSKLQLSQQRKRIEKSLENKQKQEMFKQGKLQAQNRKKFLRELQQEERYFWKTCDSFPDYLTRKLEKMPSNKGYIWRGTHFYGKIPLKHDNNTTYTLFETKNKIQYIHIYTPTSYSVYQKKHKDRPKVLLSRVKRRNKSRQIQTIFESLVV